MKKFTTEEISDLLNRVCREEISFSRMVEILNERVSKSDATQFKDGDFVVNVCGAIIIFKNKVEDSIYDHAYLGGLVGAVIFSDTPSIIPIKRYATEEEKQKMLDKLAKEGKRWNEEKKCVEDIPKRKFKKGDKVRIKHGVSSKTSNNIRPVFMREMDDLIGKTMTVDRYINDYVVCNDYGWKFNEDWLEPYVEELKEGDLAIFWNNGVKHHASVRVFDCFFMRFYCDIGGVLWQNAIKFESIEQYEKLLKGKI